MNMKKELILDFNRMTLDQITIGQPLSLLNNKEGKAYNNYELGYSANMMNGLVDNIFICFVDGYSSYKHFSGRFLIEDSFIEINELSHVEYIKQLFGSPVSEWDDGVELNLRFIVAKFQLEFSWAVQGNTIILNYLCIDFS